MTVVIAGCGDLGIEVGLRFAELGHRVMGLRRNIDRLPAAITGQSIDLTREQPILPADTELVVVAIAAGSPTVDAYRAAYVDGLRHVLDALDALDGRAPRRVLLVSSTAVYDINDASWVDEQTPANPKPGTDTVLLEAERMLHARIPTATVLRLSGIYGPGRERLITQVREGKATVSAASRHTNRIHRDDAAAAIVHLLTRDEAPAPLYLGVDHAPILMNDVVTFLAAELGLPQPSVNDAPSSSQRGGDKRLSNRLLLETGFTFSFPTYQEGYRALLDGRGTRHT
ncbi:NAD-dependent epimerase/dehydratase family protein [Cryobacterium psychrophilum]|uniref:NAD-dependent epimerase/dehydratase family protein n=1 Tax=Cryobacterium psychrophilum TaxID=41988 RepID=A0A4Y8KKN0_9MICO|nr:NAD-dependent epimerase/dehydratase family protein [Cryobacterium psychrophilum]TDW30146.1 nucleoside-diphosphate-sugar epimerase [Cryobacterium psychrophilum]TFD77378.1 NAD-dependent epimerase/dehydratase family protein [Cryobacterium psychrophilum]